MSRVEGSTVLVTGGASGIGRLVGERLLSAGAARLVIWDVQADALAAVVAELGGADRGVTGVCIDITDVAAVRAAARDLEDGDVAPDLLVNNAGIIVGRPFIEHGHADIERTMAVNALAPMHIARELLPGMVRRRRGHIVNIASAAGMVSNPGMAVYCASKWAAVGWSDSLRLELQRSGSGVHVTTVMPYYIDTGMFAGVRSPFLPILKPDRVADAIVNAIRRDRILLRLPRLLDVLPLLRGVMPARVFDRVAGDWLGVYRSMDTFRGRTD